MRRRSLLSLLPAIGLATPALAQAPAQVLNLYSSRHYDSDRALYDAFTKETGIRVRLIEGDADQLIQRIQTEGANSPADVLITVDAARLARAKAAGILRPINSEILNSRIPASLRDPDGTWYAVSKRARVIMYDKQDGPPEGLTRFEDLADPRFRGQICVRSSSHPYNTSLTGWMLAADGEAATEAWARGLAANFARPPQGGDRDQFRAIPSGQCKIAIANTYYLGGMATSSREEDRAIAARIGVIFPNQAEGDRGAHVNISGAGVVKTAPHPEVAQRFLEYLTTVEAQQIFAVGNMEYPVVAGVPIHPVLEAFGSFRESPVNANIYGANAAEALRIMQRAGWR